MSSLKSLAPAALFSPSRILRINRIRLNTDIIGMMLVRILMPYTVELPGWVRMVLSIYNIMALVTILTVDATRLPEAGTTRIAQKKAWLFMLGLLPVFIAVTGFITWAFQVPVHLFMIPSVGIIVACYMDELLFRNILQPKLRKLGFSRWGAIVSQSVLYALAFFTAGLSLGLVLISFVLGLCNGWVVYKYRTLWPAFVLSLVVHFIILGK